MVGALAAKSKRAEQIIIPALDVLQSVPVLSFLAMTITGFIQLFPNSLLGPECATIFVIFTSQVWNITFSFYQSLKMIPPDLCEVSLMFQLSSWQRFWKVEVPFSMPGLLWNMMMSMSASWFFVVISESIDVAHQSIRLPGLGSYIALAIEMRDLHALGYAILTMIIVIFLYDQILFRPLIAWSEKFKAEQSNQEYQSWLIDLIRQSNVFSKLHYYCFPIKDHFINGLFRRKIQFKEPLVGAEYYQRYGNWLWNTATIILILVSIFFFFKYILFMFPLKELVYVLFLGLCTATRVIILIILSSIIWIPIGVWIGLRPSFAQKTQPIIQFLAAFPANLFYPLFVILIVKYHLNVEIWITPLMILGTQWYILFNVIAGSSMIPRDLYLVADNFGLKKWQWWKRLALPGIFPFYITGAISAAGGAWNASIVAEWVSWGPKTLKATGLGEYIQASTITGDFPKIVLGTLMMCIYVLLFNHLIWRPLYRLAQTVLVYQ